MNPRPATLAHSASPPLRCRRRSDRRPALPALPGLAILVTVAVLLAAPATAQQGCEPRVQVELRDPAPVLEPLAGSLPATFTVVLSPAPTAPVDGNLPLCSVEVFWRTLDGRGSATAGADYRSSRGSVLLTDQVRQATFSVPLLADGMVEGDEDLFVGIDDLGFEGDIPPQVVRGVARAVIRDATRPSSLEPVGSPSVLVASGESATLEVRVVGPDGAPVAAALVLWEIVSGEGSFGGSTPPAQGDPGVTRSDARGIATVVVTPDPRPGTVRVRAALPDDRAAVEFEVTVEGDLADLFGDSAPGQRSVAGVLDRACVDATGQFGSFCGYVFGLSSSDQRSVVNQATPREAAGQGNVTLQMAHNQFDYLETRLEALRSGTAAVQTRVALLFDDAQLQLADLGRGAARHRDEEAWLADRVERAVQVAEARLQDDGPDDGASAGGGATGGMELDEPFAAPSRLGLFVSGRISLGDRAGTTREEGFEVDVQGLTAGLDYRVTGSFVAGAAVSYMQTDLELDGDGGGLDGDSWSLAAYGTWFGDAAYLETVASYGRNDFDQVRHVDLPVPFQGMSRWAARAEVEGDQLAATVTAGYDHAFGAASLDSFVRGSWVDATLDPYREEGGGPFDLEVREQTIESLLGEVGFALSYAASYGWGVLQPTATASYLHEFEDDVRLIRGRFVEDVQSLEFVVPTEVRAPDFFNVGAGLTAVTAGGRSFYVFYDRELEREGLSMETWTFGLRLEL